LKAEHLESHPKPLNNHEVVLTFDLIGTLFLKVFEKLKEAYEKERFQWAIQLTDCLLSVGEYTREAKVSLSVL